MKSVGGLIKGVFELDIELSNESTVKPDFIGYYELEGINFYLIFEFKKRTIFSKNDINNSIKPQYKNYLQIQVKNFDSTLIPVNSKAEVFIDYVFYNSPEDIILKIIDTVPILKPVNVYCIDLKNKKFFELNVKEGTLNHKYINNLMEISNQNDIWEKVYIPFLLDDILDISGTKDGKINIERNAGIILTNSFLQFIISRKIKEKDTDFRVMEFINYILRHNCREINIGRQEKEALRSKVRMFLHFLAEEIHEKIEIPEIIRKLGINHFRIILRNTETITGRISDIKNEIIFLFTQRKITDYFDNNET
jgi:hypothetical protein